MPSRSQLHIVEGITHGANFCYTLQPSEKHDMVLPGQGDGGLGGAIAGRAVVHFIERETTSEGSPLSRIKSPLAWLPADG